MPWMYQEFQRRFVPEVSQDLLMHLISLNPREATASAKVEVADSDTGAARGIIFWNSHPPAAPPALPPTATWKHERYSTNRDFERKLYIPIRDKLDILNNQSSAYAYYAKVFFTNRSTGDAYMSIYWPE